MALKSDRYCRRWAISVLGDNQVCLACTRRFTLVGILAVQENNYIRILFYTIMKVYAVSDEIMSPEDGCVIHWLRTYAFD
jgi:hypothetical protein